MRGKFGLMVLAAVTSVSFAGCGGGTGTPAPGGNGTGNPLPSVTSISPASGTVGDAAFTLTVTGSNFVLGTVVKWAGTALTTTFVSSTSVTAAVPASDLSSAGTADVTATNPTPGGGTTVAKTFNINNPAPVVMSLSQITANVGSGDVTLTVTGSGFISTSVVNWNGSARTTTFGSGTQLTASISSSDLSIAGSAHVSVSNPSPGGGSSSNLTFTITPQIANGNALPGDPNSLAVDATSDVPPVSVDSSQVQNGVIMTRLDVRFAKDATIAQVNGALAAIGAGIVSMSHGFTSVTIGIPPQNSFDALNTLVAQLEESPGILFAGIGYVPQTRRVFPGSPTLTTEQDISHLLPARFPAAWNLLPANIVGDPANDTVLRSCPFSSVPVVVTDVFSKPVPSNFRELVPSAGEPDDPDQGFGTQHGYSVTEVLNAAAFGANPFPYSGCNDIQLVQLGKNITPTQQVDLMVNGMPGNERFIVSRSMGYPDQCAASPCVPPRDILDRPLARANDALYWKEKTFDRWSNFLMVVAAGNERNAESTSIYPATGDSHFDDFVTIGQLTDTQFQFVNDDSLWTPSTAKIAQGFLSLKPTDVEQINLQQAIAASLNAGQAVADNVIVVGATKNQPLTQQALQNQHVTPDQLTESVFSDSNPDVFAVGQDIFGTGNTGLNGTSFSTPQVAGLASYLWMLSPDLRNFQPISATKNAIVANTRNKFIDAYASALSLDGTITPQTAPMRLALLDLNGNGRFDDVDVDKFLRQFFTVDPNGNILDTSAGGPADFSRFDLNGDGFTTGFSGLRERFDLDRVGSVQYGASQYSSVTEKIEDLDTQFDENAVSDLDILCYYAYSPMYQGDVDARKTLLGGRCGLAVTPAKVTLVPGQTQMFTANTSANDPVTWNASCGSIDATGNYTAGNDVGPCTVRATDTPHPTISGTAEVTLITGTFGAETGYTAEVLGIDFVTGNEIFPQQILSASNTSSTLKPGPLDATSSGSYQQPGNFQPVIYSVSAHAEGPIVERGVTPSSGTFTSTISCTADGDSKKNSDDSVTLPFMPALTVSSGGALEFSVPPGGLTVSVSGTLTRGATKGVTDGKLFMTGDAFFDTIDAGGPDQSVEFDLNDGQQSSGNSPSSVPFSKTMHVSQPGGFDVHWQLTARCFAGAGAETGLHIARNATVTFTYTASQ